MPASPATSPTYKNDKGYIGPALAGTGKRFNAAWVYHWLKDPQALRPGTIEPNQHMTDDEARSLTAFLMSLKSGGAQGGDEEMKPVLIAVCAVTLLMAGCSHKSKQPAPLQATATGTAIVESSGGKQIGYIGMPLDQPVVVQVNDASGSAVAGAAVYFSGPAGVSFTPAAALTDSSGQVTSTVSLGQQAGRYKLVASTRDASGKNIELTLDEIALGYQQTVGAQLNAQYCVRCHDPESTPLRVSNMDNLSVKPHPFTEGDTLNKMSDADLVAIISHGGPGVEQIAADAALGIHAFQERHRCAGVVHSRGGRSTLRSRRAGVCAEVSRS